MDTKNIILGKNKQYVYLSDYNRIINRNIEKHFLENAHHRQTKVNEIKITPGLIKKKLTDLYQVIFEITQNCNLRCKYCVFNGEYINKRSLSTKNMSLKTARAALDNVFDFTKNRDKKELVIGFYGGEPLLNKKLVKEIVDYSRSLFSGWNIMYSLTTNLTLLDDKMIDFFIEHNFKLLVSLDGPEENHDAKRVTQDNGGSFNIIYNNLKKIKEKNSDYFLRKVSFSCVFSPELSLQNVYDFFIKNDLVYQNGVRIAPVDPYDTSYYDKYPYDKSKLKTQRETVLKKIKAKLNGTKNLSLAESQFLKSLLTAVTGRLENQTYNNLYNACLFDERLYVDAEGKFHICERVNNRFSIGNINDGFDIEKMAEMVKDYIKIQEKQCSDCNIRFLCSRCYAPFCRDGEFAMAERFCKDSKEGIINALEGYIELKEENLLQAGV